MKALSLALISLLSVTACAKDPAPSKIQTAPAAESTAEQTPFLFTLATCLPPAQSIYDDTKRLIFLVNMNEEGKGPMDLMFETEPSADSNNELGFFVLKGGELHVEESSWVVSGRYVSEGGSSSIDAKMPANVPGEQPIVLSFGVEGTTIVETWTCRVH